MWVHWYSHYDFTLKLGRGIETWHFSSFLPSPVGPMEPCSPAHWLCFWVSVHPPKRKWQRASFFVEDHWGTQLQPRTCDQHSNEPGKRKRNHTWYTYPLPAIWRYDKINQLKNMEKKIMGLMRWLARRMDTSPSVVLSRCEVFNTTWRCTNRILDGTHSRVE